MKYTNNLYKILKKHNDITQIQLCDESHDIFKAHFPNNPILPGFLQIDIAKELYELNFTRIKKAKFLSIVKPKDIIEFEYIKEKNKILIKSTTNKKISEIIL